MLTHKCSLPPQAHITAFLRMFPQKKHFNEDLLLQLLIFSYFSLLVIMHKCGYKRVGVVGMSRRLLGYINRECEKQEVVAGSEVTMP